MSAVRKIPVSLLRPGMVLYRPVYGPDGQLWLNSGVELKSKYINSLWRAGISFVFISDPFLADVVVRDLVSEETRRHAVKAVKETLQSAKLLKRNSLLLDKRFSSIVEKLVREVLASKDVMINLADIRDVDDY
ncbi:MAG: phosphodiesterase, partial [Dethiobacter sp.]